jgi:flagellar hook assembly protein FlgD
VRTLREGKLGAGPQVLHWDGRDQEGDEMANGTYLYVLRGLGGGHDGSDLIRTGKLVIMR